MFKILLGIVMFNMLLTSCTGGESNWNSLCYKKNYNTIIDSAKSVKKIIKDDCYKNPKAFEWIWRKKF